MEKKKAQDKLIKTRCRVCGSPAMKGFDVCYFHNEATLQKRKENAAKGGRKKITALIPFNVKTEDLKGFKKIRLENISDVNNFLRGIIMFSANGLMDIKSAKFYSQLCRELIRGLVMEKKNKYLS